MILITALCLIYSFFFFLSSFFHASTWFRTPCVRLLICTSLVGEIGGRSLGEIDGKMGWNLLSGSERKESALMGIKGTLEWKSLDNVFNFFQEADDSNLLSSIPLWNVACKINFLLFKIDRFFLDSFPTDSIQACLPTYCKQEFVFKKGVRLAVLDTAVGLWEKVFFLVAGVV